MQGIRNFFRQNEWVILTCFILVFIFIRFFGTDLPLHQDEYKWPKIVNPSLGSETEIPHPPLSQFIYKSAGQIVGFNVHFRFVPLFFGTINLLLLYFYMKMKWGRKTAMVGASIFTLSYFSILASLMVDTDGEILPFFFLISLIAYEKTKETFSRKILWGIVLGLSILLGLFVKISFFLVAISIIFDFLFQKRNKISKKDLLKYLGYFIGFIVFIIFTLILSQKIFPFFSLASSVSYWEHFWNTDRGWFQTFIQLVKVILYASPFFILTPLFISKDDLKDSLPHTAYLFFGFLFYIIIFDFSIGALDRYLQFIIIPFTVLTSLTIFNIYNDYKSLLPEKKKKIQEIFLIGLNISLVLFFVQFINHFVPSLHPKTEWINRIISLKWNFLYPFSGGSGPLGFYVSFLFMALCWLISLILVIVGFFKKNLRIYTLALLIPIGLVYNFTFAEEYLFGKINGSAPKLLSTVVEFIKNNDEIKFVTVYNDNGGDEIKNIGKYRKRLYTDPKFDIEEKIDSLNQYKEHYLEIDIPKIDPNSIYRKYLDSCDIIYKQTNQKISAMVYDCRRVGDVKLE